ncbi:hypothetical protein AB4Y44_25930 [Paraburkholderia sp. BR10937]|uniref:hypothetical protein n=1 Tax=Paraburkholderia sp. BR10937 TaxID=3236994 RepID=UPI0034D1E16E
MAFAIAIALYAYRAHLRNLESLIQSARPADRAKLATSALERLNISTERMTRDQIFILAQEQLRERRHRLTLMLIGAIVLFALLAAVAIEAIIHDQPVPPSPVASNRDSTQPIAASESSHVLPKGSIEEALHGKTILYVLVSNNIIWVLTGEVIPGDVRSNPTGDKYPVQQVNLVKIASRHKVDTVKVANSPITDSNLIYEKDGYIYVIINYRVPPDTEWSNASTRYRFNINPFHDLGAETLFTDKNWGAFPMFLNGHLQYFSYEVNSNKRYYWVVDNQPGADTTKEEAIKEWDSETAKSSDGIMPFNGVDRDRIIESISGYSNSHQPD